MKNNTNQPQRQSEVDDSTNKGLHLTVRNREQVLVDTPVRNISSVNKNGPFDVLFQHAHFISIIQEKIVIRHEDGRIEELPIDQGIIKVRKNRINIFLGVKRS